MKSLKVALAALLVSAGLINPILRAEDAPPPPPGEHGGERKGGPRGERGDRLKMISEQLGLTEDQKAKIKPIIEDEMKAMRALREDTSLEQDAKRAKGKEIAESHRTQIRALLTPEQQTKFDAMPKPGERRGGGEGRPKKEKE